MKKIIQELKDTNKKLNTWVKGVSEGVEREAGLKDVFNKTIIENFPNVQKELQSKIPEEHRSPSKINQKWSSQHIIIKLYLDEHKENILKYAFEKTQ